MGRSNVSISVRQRGGLTHLIVTGGLVSDTSQGPDRSQASNGKSYDPHLAPPGYASPQPKVPVETTVPFYKRWWLWAVVVVILLLATVSGVALQSKSTNASNPSTSVTSSTNPNAVARATTTTTPRTSTTKPKGAATTEPSSPSTTTASPKTALPLTTGPTTTEVAPAAAVASNCTPRSRAGECFWPGEYCRKSDYGTSGVGGDGKPMTCVDNNGWKWVST